MKTVLIFIGALIYLCIGGMLVNLLDEVDCFEEPSNLCIIFWPIVVLLLITSGLAYLSAEAGRAIGEWINGWR